MKKILMLVMMVVGISAFAETYVYNLPNTNPLVASVVVNITYNKEDYDKRTGMSYIKFSDDILDVMYKPKSAGYAYNFEAEGFDFTKFSLLKCFSVTYYKDGSIICHKCNIVRLEDGGELIIHYKVD